MADYITTREYAALHGVPFETVRSWIKVGKLATIKIGAAVFVDADTPIPAKRKPGVKTAQEKDLAEFNRMFKSKKLKIRIVPAYYVSVEDGNGKEVASDFTFCGKEDAKRLGEKLKAEVEANNGKVVKGVLVSSEGRG